MATAPEIIDFLVRHDALEVHDPPAEWPTVGSDEEVYEVDWGRLFPRRPTDYGGEDWEVYGGELKVPPELEEEILDGEVEAGPPGWDMCAWYQPMHFYGYGWGIFIREECMFDIAKRLRNPFLRSRCRGRPLAPTLTRAGFAALFLHEQYHHKTECLGVRLHVVEQTRRYVPYFRGVYLPACGTTDQLEEGLANADSYLRLGTEPYSAWLRGLVRGELENYLKRSFNSTKGGYGLASAMLSDEKFNVEEERFKAQFHEATLTPKQSPLDWRVAPNINQSMVNIRQNIYTVVPRGSTPVLPVIRGTVAPLSTRQLEKYLRKRRFTIASGRGKGSHRVFAQPGYPMIVLPDSGDLSPAVLKNTAYALRLRNVRALEEAVRSAS